MTLERAAVIIGEYRPVLITMEEELRMAKLGLKSGALPNSATRTFRFPVSAWFGRSTAVTMVRCRTA